MKKVEIEKGITIITLIITIIILLIIAGIVINLTLWNNGLFTISKQVAKNYINEYHKELNLVNNTNNMIVNEFNNIPDYKNEHKKETIEEVKTTHKVKKLEYDWTELENLARIISNNYGINERQVNNRTEEVTITIDEKTYTLGIGDWLTINYNDTNKRVSILGFNHDELSNTSSYNDGKTHKYAGISFQLEKIEDNKMNPKDSNMGGWGDSFARERLNNICLENMENKLYIKEVKKTYLATYNNPKNLLKSNDKLWLLSCAELYGNKFIGTSGHKQLIEEGEQYLYGIKESTEWAGDYWWIRTPALTDDKAFLHCYEKNNLNATRASGNNSYRPGFCI